MAESSATTISATEPDWRRENLQKWWDPGRRLLRCIRTYQALMEKNGVVAVLARKLCVIRHIIWSISSGADIPLNCRIGGGLLIPHPNGIVIHPEAEIGVNCLIHQQVTIGTTRSGGVPRILGHVDIGAGAKILGAVTVREHAQVGANAVVTHDVPRHAVAVGIPARILMPETRDASAPDIEPYVHD